MTRFARGSVYALVVAAVLAGSVSIEAGPQDRDAAGLTREERAARALELRKSRQQQRQALPGRGKYDAPPGGKDSWGMTPVIELAEGSYKGERGGLYGAGSNEMPEAVRGAAALQLAKVVPRDRDGNPARDGKVVLLSIGMSNTHAEFVAFQKLAKTRTDLDPHLVLVDGAQGANDAAHWADPERVNTRTNMGLWERVGQILRSSRVSPQQVQVAWVKLVLAHPERYGEFPEHARALERSLVGVMHLLKQNYPNVSLAFVSSRIYAGYSMATLNPEPYAYESAFTMRWLIESQQAGSPELNWDPARGPVRSPLLLWGPYMWADGTTPRASDGLTWLRSDFNRDGVHPNSSGESKVARQLMDFFTGHEFARPWFVGAGAE